MPLHVFKIFFGILLFISAEGHGQNVVVADSASHTPLPNASVYDRNGEPIAMTDRKGRLPDLPASSFPVTLRYIGFNDKILQSHSILRKSISENNITENDKTENGPTGDFTKGSRPDTIFLSESISELPEVLVEQRRRRILHILAYVREYSTLSSYTDTVFLFREKMVDFMIPTDDKVKFRGWSAPRVLAGNSYYRFTDRSGLDSVSDESHNHFSWADWMGLPPVMTMPERLMHSVTAADTLFGKYSPTEIWRKEKDRVSIDLDILADTASRKWVPKMSRFFLADIDFDRFKVNFTFDNVLGDSVSAPDLVRYSYSIESNGRGLDMFRFHRKDEPFFVTTDADIFILDRELISVKEAGKWRNRKFDTDEIGIFEPLDVPPLAEETLLLIDRVNSLDKEGVRLDRDPDKKMIYSKFGQPNLNFRFGNRLLSMLKDVTGITSYRSRRNFNKGWNKFKKYRVNPASSKPPRK